MSSTDKIFINCPFDNTYFPILKSILFTTVYLGLEPLISETSDSGSHRLGKIKRLIQNANYSIHDISRIELNDRGFPRFNMPFECGVDLGYKFFTKSNKKKILILDAERYRYQEFMSDIAGNDIKAHENEPETAVKNVRDWIRVSSGKKLPWASTIWLEYNEFTYDINNILESENINFNDIGALPFSDWIQLIKDWVEERETI